MLTSEAREHDEAIARTALVLRLAVGRTARRLRTRAGGGLTPSQAALLDTVARHGPIAPSRIAEAEGLKRPTITRLVKNLRDRGLIEARPDPADRRSYLLTLSEEGVALRNSRREQRETYLASLLGRVRPIDLAVLERAAHLLLELLEEDEP